MNTEPSAFKKEDTRVSNNDTFSSVSGELESSNSYDYFWDNDSSYAGSFEVSIGELDLIEQISFIPRPRDIRTFCNTIEKRNNYLDKLKNLSDGWISGTSKVPSESSINLSKSLLLTFRNWLLASFRASKITNVPKIVMGPIPTGGLTIEFHSNENNALFVSIYNGGQTEIEIKKDDYFRSVWIPQFNQLDSRVIDNYDSISE